MKLPSSIIEFGIRQIAPQLIRLASGLVVKAAMAGLIPARSLPVPISADYDAQEAATALWKLLTQVVGLIDTETSAGTRTALLLAMEANEPKIPVKKAEAV
jgi:hypothetical protein